MKLNYHNKIEINTKKNHYVFYNNMLDSVYEKIANLESFFDKLAIGTGFYDENLRNYKLGNFSKLINLNTKTTQFNLEENNIFIEKFALVNFDSVGSEYITEAGITSNLDDKNNPTIYNYFSLINDEFPNGIKVENGEDVSITVTIYLSPESTQTTKFTKGENKFIEFLLGNGIKNKKVYAARGLDLSDNVFISHSNLYQGGLFECEFSFDKNSELLLSFSADLSSGETNEIVFLIDDSVFARINTKDFAKPYETTTAFSPKTNYVLDLGSGVISYSNIVNNDTGIIESDIYPRKYGSKFMSKISLPFNNVFDNSTMRFLSKEGDRIIFYKDGSIFIYKVSDYKLQLITSSNLQIQNVYKIICFDNYLFVLTKGGEYAAYFYRFVNNKLSATAANLDILGSDAYNYFNNFIDADIVSAKDGTIMFGFYSKTDSSTIAYTLYLSFTNSMFVLNDFVYTTNYNFSHILAFHKNNFCDAEIMYLQSGETSSTCRRVVHGKDKRVTDVYTTLAYYFTKNTTSIATKSRAIVIEKNDTPNFWLYYYPQIYRFELSEFSSAVKNYISTNLLYLIQKLPDSQYKIYNLVGYNKPTEFIDGLPTEINQNKILTIEFLEGIVLFFVDDEAEPIIAYSINEDSVCIENVSSNESTYSVTLTKNFPLGSNNEGVVATFSANVKIWFFQIQFIKFLTEKIYLYFLTTTMTLTFMYFQTIQKNTTYHIHQS